MNTYLSRVLLVAVFVIVGHSSAWGQLFQDPLESGAAWSLVHEGDASDNFVTFGFDYSALGIPEAPNTQTGDAATSGVRMIANRDFGATNSVAAFPTGMNFTGSFTFQFDMWLNAVGPFPAGGTGSTEFGGGAIGFDNATTHPLSGASFLTTGEGGSSNDYRLYAHDEFQLFSTHLHPFDNNRDGVVNAIDYAMWRDTLGEAVEDPYDGADSDGSGVIDIGDYQFWVSSFGETQANDLYAPEMLSGNADGNTYVEGIFPGQEAPQVQQNIVFPDPPGGGQTGTLKDGTVGFRWVTMLFTVDTVAGTAQVQMTDADTSVTANIGTFTLDNTYVDRGTIETKLLTTMEGNVAITYRDLFSSLIDDNLVDLDLSFGLFDNVIVEQIPGGNLAGGNVPEPATWLLLVGGAGCLWMARRKSY